MKKKKYLIILINIILLNLVVHANTGSYSHGKGGTLYPIKSRDLSMLSEKIIIDVYKCDNMLNECNLFYYEYKCEYHFKNTGSEQTFQLGFPIDYGYFVMSGTQHPVNPFFEDCIIEVDGTSVEYRKYIHGINHDIEDVNYDEVFGFTVPFNDNEEKVITVSYNTVNYYSCIAASYDSETGFQLQYILKSAKTLKDPIGKAEIIVQFHFPIAIKEDKKAIKYKVKESKTDPFKTLQYSYTNFYPEEDINISFNLLNNPEDNYLGIDDYIKLLNGQNNIKGYFNLRNQLTHEEAKIAKDKTRISNALHDFILSKLKAAGTGNLLYGFLVYDIINQTSLGFSKSEKDSYKKDVIDKTQKAFMLEKEILQTITDGLKSNPEDKDLVLYATRTLHSVPYFVFITGYEENLHFNNLYIENLNNLLKQKEYISLKENNWKKLKTLYFPILDSMFAVKKDNIKEIFDFESEIHEAFTFREDWKTGFNLQDYYVSRINELTKKVEKKSIDQEQIDILVKLLAATIQGGDCFVSVYSDFMDINIENRDIIRRAYYSLGNYSFNKDFEKSIKYYRTGIAYGLSSPLFDYLGGSIDCIFFGDFLYHNYMDNTDKKSIGEDHPWWKDLPNTQHFSQNDIIALYTPERLLKLKLEDWDSEGELNAPAYYLAYNTACAYSRLEKVDDALKWLKVSIRLNPDMKKLIPGDKDLSSLREKKKTEVNLLLK